MDNVKDIKTMQEKEYLMMKQERITRRNFAKKAMGLGFLSTLTLMNVPKPALSWLDGGFSERDDLDDALKVLVKTYNSTDPYLHKFYDALVKVHLRDLDFAVRKGLEKEYIEHYLYALSPMVERHIKKAVQKSGKDIFLWFIFERSCGAYQLWERVDRKKGECSFPCSYKEILEHIRNQMGTYIITWEDVCQKWCSPFWHGVAQKAGDIKIKIEPGEICRVKLV